MVLAFKQNPTPLRPGLCLLGPPGPWPAGPGPGNPMFVERVSSRPDLALDLPRACWGLPEAWVLPARACWCLLLGLPPIFQYPVLHIPCSQPSNLRCSQYDWLHCRTSNLGVGGNRGSGYGKGIFFLYSHKRNQKLPLKQTAEGKQYPKAYHIFIITT